MCVWLYLGYDVYFLDINKISVSVNSTRLYLAHKLACGAHETRSHSRMSLQNVYSVHECVNFSVRARTLAHEKAYYSLVFLACSAGVCHRSAESLAGVLGQARVLGGSKELVKASKLCPAPSWRSVPSRAIIAIWKCWRICVMMSLPTIWPVRI